MNRYDRLVSGGCIDFCYEPLAIPAAPNPSRASPAGAATINAAAPATPAHTTIATFAPVGNPPLFFFFSSTCTRCGSAIIEKESVLDRRNDKVEPEGIQPKVNVISSQKKCFFTIKRE
jgi:hypothetical protein